jgi:hypothetical protein
LFTGKYPSMIKLTSIALLLALSIPAAAQVSEPNAESAYPPPSKGDRPDIPGTFALELGLNKALDAPDRFSTALWGSRTINVYYQYEMRIMKSKFSIVPGFGLSLERYKFKNLATLGYDPAANDSLKLLLPTENTIPEMRKSQLVTNYFEVPLELRFSTNPSDPARSFKIGVGGRIGYLYDGFTKLKYKENGETKQLKDKQDWNLTRFRYGVFGKIGLGNFSLFGYYNLTPLFEEGKGPGEKNVVKDFQTFTLGFSLSAF